jgi:protein-L-isoaspartate O-methyltransferase
MVSVTPVAHFLNTIKDSDFEIKHWENAWNILSQPDFDKIVATALCNHLPVSWVSQATLIILAV